MYYKKTVQGDSGKLLIACITSYEITDAIVTRNNISNEWEIKLKLTGEPVTLYTKRNELRTFSRLGTVADYLNEIGVSSFYVRQVQPRRVLW